MNHLYPNPPCKTQKQLRDAPRFRYNQLPSAGAAVATAAAITLMATLQQTLFEAIEKTPWGHRGGGEFARWTWKLEIKFTR